MILFMSFIGYLVYRSFNQKIDLVADNYYEQEVKFQQQIDKTKNAIELGVAPEISVVAGGQKITFPEKQVNMPIEGSIYFFRASDDRMDFNVPVSLNEKGEQIIEQDKFSAGKYKVKIEWTCGGKSFYHEQYIVI